ncbi:Zn-dependent protease with chaperone function [hydrothermal vent metagenome]|uniref:Zn-dependent protease with chaperone function n=1 Tax=hydrothermal vent metagenome TaxID=652676 RepID=A0A3B0RJR5_9ZZZZ
MEVSLSRRQLIVGLAAGTVTACVTNPETGEQQFMLVSDSQLSQMSATAWADAKTKTPLSRDPYLNNQLASVGKRISTAANRQNENWEYAVFDSDQKNAFVMPGGKVGFYRGIMEFSDNEDQIAAVMGHETGHVTGRHAAARYSRTMAANAGLTAANVALSRSSTQYRNEIAAVLGAGVTFGVILPFSRKHELQADKLGVDYMYRAGYDTRQSVRLWERMAADSAGARKAEFLSTHPSPETRVRELDAYIRAKGYA